MEPWEEEVDHTPPKVERPEGKRVCYFCKHIDVEMAEQAWTEYTPGAGWGMRCTKGYFNIGGDDCSRYELARCLEMAETCRDFEDRAE